MKTFKKIFFTFCFIFQVCIKNSNTYQKTLANKLRGMIRFDTEREVFIYENGKIEDKFPLSMSNSLYEEVVEYEKNQQLKDFEFEAKLSECQNHAKRELRDVISYKKGDDDQITNISEYEKFEQLEQKIQILSSLIEFQNKTIINNIECSK